MSPTESLNPFSGELSAGPGRPAARRRLRQLGRLAAATGLATSLIAGWSLQASADPGSRSPNTSAEDAGITAAGGGYAGWAMQSRSGTQSRSPHSESATPKAAKISGIPGLDVASYQGKVNWKNWWSKGKRFAYVKATEGTSYRSGTFSQQYSGSYKVGMIRGAYHFARPDGAGGAAQADYFAAHGGGWSADGKTLPGMLDMEDNYTGGDRCYNKSASQLVSWVQNFISEYRAKTSRDPVIYTNASFWRDCMGNTTKFNQVSPLMIAHWASKPPTSLPGGWPYYTFWQYSGTGTDLDAFNGTKAQLKKLATG